MAGQLLALQVPGMQQATARTVVYGDGLQMDLYQPPAARAATPVVLVLHGATNGSGPKDFGGLVGWDRC